MPGVLSIMDAISPTWPQILFSLKDRQALHYSLYCSNINEKGLKYPLAAFERNVVKALEELQYYLLQDEDQRRRSKERF